MAAGVGHKLVAAGKSLVVVIEQGPVAAGEEVAVAGKMAFAAVTEEGSVGLDQ
jgi:hypothetical protein